MEFAILGSGSRGNATLVRHDDTILLIDCGFSVREMGRRLARLQLELEAVDALVLTHEHADHASGAERFARAAGCPLYATAGTSAAAGLNGSASTINPHREFEVGSLRLCPFPVPHDAREPAQFVIHGGDRKLGILSDAGAATPHMGEALAACDALLLEFNHCSEMLANGPYPPALRARVGGRTGHLSNDQSAALLADLAHPRLQYLVLTHLSEKNNRPDLALDAARAALGGLSPAIAIASQDEPLDWCGIA